MRIVGGEWRGRPLAAPGDRGIRPTADRTRESVFNILAHRRSFDGLRVVDLFAGSGALGIEALSRGAAFALFVDISPQSRALVRENLDALGAGHRGRLFRRDAASLGEIGTMAPFDLAFADPPYGMGLAEKAAASLRAGGWLAPGATIVIEERQDCLPGAIAGFVLEDSRRFGETAVGFFRPA
jgi:16S rRNA (guanine966-N2)-methyltransferase